MLYLIIFLDDDSVKFFTFFKLKMCFIILFNPLLDFYFFHRLVSFYVWKKVNATFIKKGEIRVNNYFFEPACAACHVSFVQFLLQSANSINFAIISFNFHASVHHFLKIYYMRLEILLQKHHIFYPMYPWYHLPKGMFCKLSW